MSCRGGNDFFSSQIGDETDEEYVRIRYGTPILYEPADPECTEENALEDLGVMKVWLSRQENVELVEVDLSGVSGQGLRHKLIEDTLVGYKQKVHVKCNYKTNTKSCESPEISIVDDGERLNICRKGGAYPRESLENVALAALSGISFISKLHENVYPNENIPKLTLLIHPQILDEHKTMGAKLTQYREGVRTDNAFWFQNNGKNYIAAFPESREHQQSSSDARVWELPSIMAHEWGHNLFSYYAPSLVDPLGSDGQDSFIGPSQRIDLSTSALNEAFADLTGFLAFESEFSELGWCKLHGVYFNRYVASSRFDDGSRKVIDNWLLHHYFEGSEHLHIQSPSPDPTDDHVVGAIIAHGLYRIFKPFEYVREHLSEDFIESAFVKTILWAKRMEASFDKNHNQSAVDFLQGAIEHAVNIERDLQSAYVGHPPALPETQCEAIRTVFMSFPNLSENCFNAGGGNVP